MFKGRKGSQPRARAKVAAAGGWLTGAEIERQRERGRIVIDPFEPSALNPNSYNYTLHPSLKRLTDLVIDLKSEDNWEELEITESGLRLEPGECYLGSTNEQLGSGWYPSLITGRSSIGRKFITNHVTAGLVDVGFLGRITLEITVTKPTVVYAHIPFGQIFWFSSMGLLRQYSGRYQAQARSTPSRLHLDGPSSCLGRREIE